jgi:hypothetical protein
LAVGPARSAEEARPAHALWIEPGIDPSDAEVVARLVNHPAGRLIVPGLVHGETTVPGLDPFPQAERYRGRPDWLPDLIRRAHLAERQVFLALDCLCWEAPEAREPHPAFARHPDWIEHGSDGPGEPGGRYASPFHPEVVDALRALVRDLAVRYPNLDGVVFRFGLPTDRVLGYSRTARDAYLRDARTDPNSLTFGETVAERQKLGAWAAWRINAVTALLRNLAADYRSKAPKGWVAATGLADWYSRTLQERAAAPEDWLNWASGALIQEVILEGPWAGADGAGLYERCRAPLARNRKPTRLSLAVRAEGGRLPTSLNWSPRVGQPAPELVVFCTRPEDVSRAAGLLEQPFGETGHPPTILPGPDAAIPKEGLRADPRLHNRLTLTRNRVTVGQVLARLAEATGLEMTADPEIEPERMVFESVLWHNVAGWDAMTQVARAATVRGGWEKLSAGYRLHATAETPPAKVTGGHGAGPVSRHALSFGVIVNWGVLAALVAGVLFYLARRRSQPPALQPTSAVPTQPAAPPSGEKPLRPDASQTPLSPDRTGERGAS